MDFSPMEEQTVYTLGVDFLSFLVTLLPKIHQLLLTGDFVFNPSFSILLDLNSNNTFVFFL